MGFQHDSQQQHKIRGIQKAIHSAKTPAHLKPHLRAKLKEHSMYNPKGKSKTSPTTAAVAQNKPGGPQGFNTVAKNQAKIKAAPTPFRNPQGAPNLPAPSGPAGAQSSPNPTYRAGGLQKSAPKKNYKAVGGSALKTKGKVVGSAFYGE